MLAAPLGTCSGVVPPWSNTGHLIWGFPPAKSKLCSLWLTDAGQGAGTDLHGDNQGSLTLQLLQESLTQSVHHLGKRSSVSCKDSLPGPVRDSFIN